MREAPAYSLPSSGPLRGAGWQNAGNLAAELDAKRTLLRWRLHTLLAQITGDLGHYHEAVTARPDLPHTRSALGCALARAKRHAEAVPHLRIGVERDPFDAEAASALFEASRLAGDEAGARRVARDRKMLIQAAPHLKAEEWFANAPPVGDELASIIILCCNEVAYTKLCLESVLRHTRQPYELLLIDNGSTDQTPALLEEVKLRPGQARVVVITNGENRGFPAGCNQGIAQAQGDYLVFLNNDTIVTPGWLDSLVTMVLCDWPKIGMAGPVTNYTAAPQQVQGDYTDLVGLAAFALRHKQEFAGQGLFVPRLTGFCLVARRDVIDKIGGFDERYGLGFFDDDDLCVRAREAGYRLAVARDVFIHHFGSRTFTHLGVDTERQLLHNFALFKGKYGDERAAGYRLTDAVSRVPRAEPHRRNALRRG